MENKDYLHSDLLSKPCNFSVFQETYESIRRLSWIMSENHCKSLGITGKQKEEYMDVFIDDIEPVILNIVNYAIDNFEK